MPQALSPCDWAAIRAAYESGTERIYDIGKRFDVFHLTICLRAKKHGWVRPEADPGNSETDESKESHPPPDAGTAQRDPDVVLRLKVGGGEELEGLSTAKIPPRKPAAKTQLSPRPKQKGMIDRLYRVIDNNLSQLEDIMKHQSDPSIADNEKETRTIGTVIGNIEKLKGLEDDAGKSRANKSTAPANHAAETERLGRELAERLVRLAKDLRA
jgi:hypothetical protein